MSRDAVQPSGVARPQAPYSPVVVSGDLVFTAGQLAFDGEGRLIPADLADFEAHR